MFRRAVIGLAGISLAAMIAPAAQASAPAVINGTPNPPLAIAAVYFQSANSSCTGSLLQPNLIVTAAHCFVDSAGNASATPGDLEIFLPGVNTDESQPSSVHATQIIYNPVYRNQDGQEGIDVAYIVLDGALATPRITRVATQSEVVALAARDAVLSQVGYGQTVPRAVTDAYPSPFPIGMSASIDSDYAGGAKEVAIVTNGTPGTCAGDSGSPWMVEVGGELLLVGVLSSGDNPPCEPAADSGTHDYVAVVAGQGDLLAQARAAAGVPAEPTYTTCLRMKGAKPDCAEGRTWTYDFCWDAPRYRMEKFTGSGWQTVTTGTAKKFSQCGRKTPYRVTVSSTVDTTATKYRLVIPKQRGVGRVTYDPFTVTSS